jgi:hypothetical protein
MEDWGRHRINKCRSSSTKVQRDGRTPSGKRSPYGRLAGLKLLRHRVNANRRILVLCIS